MPGPAVPGAALCGPAVAVPGAAPPRSVPLVVRCRGPGRRCRGRRAGRVLQRGPGRVPTLPQLVQQLPLAGDEAGAGPAAPPPPPQQRQRGGLGLVPGHRTRRGPAAVVAGEVAGHPPCPHRTQGERLGRPQPPGQDVDGQLLAHGAQLPLPGPDPEPGQQPEHGQHEHAVDGEEAELAEGGGAVPQGVHAHREQQPAERHQQPPGPLVRAAQRGDAEADAGAGGEQGVRERGHHDAHEEGGGGDGDDAVAAGELVGPEGRAQVEDVLGEREAGGGDPGYHHPVHDPGEVAPAEEEDQQHGRGLRGLLDDRGYHRGAEGVGARRVGGRGGYPLGREAVGDDGYERRREGAPAEREHQVAPGEGGHPVQPAERGDQPGHRQHREPEAHQEPLGPGLPAHQREDDQTGHGQQGDQRAVAHPPQLPPVRVPQHRVAGDRWVRRIRRTGGHGIDPNGGGTRGWSGLPAAEEQIVHDMSLVQSLSLETGQRPELGPGRETAVGLRVLELRVGAEHLQHLLGVRLPVGGAVHQRAGLQPGGDEVEERRLDQPPLVVALLGPGVGEVDAQPVERVGAEHLAQQDDGVPVAHPDVVQSLLVGEVQQIALAGGVHVHREHIGAGVGGGHPRGGLAHPEPDLQDHGTVVAEQLGEVDHPLSVDVQSPGGPQPPQGVGLPGGHPAAARLEAADPPLEVRPGGIGPGAVREPRLALGPGTPHGGTGVPRGRFGQGFGGIHRIRHSTTESTGATGPGPRRTRSGPLAADRVQHPQRPAGDLPADRQRRGGRRGRRVQHVHRAGPLLDQEVVHQRAVTQHRLGPHAGRRPHQVLGPHRGQQSAHRLQERPLGHRAAQLARAVPPVPARQRPGARPRHGPGQLAGAHDAPAVPLPGQCRHRVGADVHHAVDAPGQMDAEERERRVRHRVHQAPYQLGPGQLVVLPAERHDPHTRVVPGQPGQFVAVQSGAVHQHPAAHDVPGRGAHGHAALGAPVHPHHPGAVADLGTRGLGEPPGDRREVAHARGAHVDRGQSAHLGLVLGDLGGAQLPHRYAVLPAALHQGVQPGQLRALGGDDQLAGDGVVDAVLGAELHHLGGAPHRVPRLERAGPVVDPAVHDPAVAPGLVAGRARLLLQHGHPGARRGPADRVRGRQPDDPPSDHEHIAVVRPDRHLHHLPRR
ncbi:hypothetical protein SGPA1_50016 [Streptomyces misionensis JCM 4497]